jgi:hypothetical protein
VCFINVFYTINESHKKGDDMNPDEDEVLIATDAARFRKGDEIVNLNLYLRFWAGRTLSGLITFDLN